MTPQSANFVNQAHIVLGRADRMLGAGLNEDAARTAYLACFHVAQACIFERTGKTSKTHKGIQTEFFRLTRADERTDQELRPFLSQAYEFKSLANYLTGPDAVASAEEAVEAVATAKRFVVHFAALVVVS